MVRVIAVFQLKSECVDEAVRLAGELVTQTRKEKGCIQYDLIQSDVHPSKVVVLENWETQADLDVHSASEHFTRLVPAIAELCTQPPDVESFSVLY